MAQNDRLQKYTIKEEVEDTGKIRIAFRREVAFELGVENTVHDQCVCVAAEFW